MSILRLLYICGRMHINLQVQIGKGGVLCGVAVIAYLKDATNHGSLL